MATSKTTIKARRAGRMLTKPQVTSHEPQATSQTDGRVKVRAAPDERPAWARPGWQPGPSEGLSAMDLIARHRAQAVFDEVLSRRRRTNLFGWADGVPPGYDPITGQKL